MNFGSCLENALHCWNGNRLELASYLESIWNTDYLLWSEEEGVSFDWYFLCCYPFPYLREQECPNICCKLSTSHSSSLVPDCKGQPGAVELPRCLKSFELKTFSNRMCLVDDMLVDNYCRHGNGEHQMCKAA